MNLPSLYHSINCCAALSERLSAPGGVSELPTACCSTMRIHVNAHVSVGYSDTSSVALTIVALSAYM